MKMNRLLLLLLSLAGSHFLFAQSQPALEITMAHLRQHLTELKLTDADIADIAVQNEVFSRHNGVTHLYLVQQHAGIPVHNAVLNANITPDGRVSSIGNRLISRLAERINATAPAISTAEAVRAGLAYFGMDDHGESLRIVEEISETEVVFDPTGLALEPIPVKLVYQPMPDRSVRLAWNVSLYQLDAQHWWNARVDALSGEVLDYFDQVVHCQFGHPAEVCGGHAPVTAKALPAKPTPLLPPVDGSVYNVYPITIESPNHGDRALVAEPAEPISSPFGWHDTDGAEGPEFTITRGNNVHAYHDIFNLNTSSGDEPDGGPALNFDFDLDLSTNQPYTQLDPIVTNLFYWNNLMHDVWYHYGFDEASGNFQTNNYGNGGEAGDPVNAEALDGSGTNNANFATPPDGNNPRMQMYLWGGGLPTIIPEGGVSITAPADLAGAYEFAVAGFGGALPDGDAPISAPVVLADDGIGVGSDACQPIQNGAALAGNIAMIDRGECEFGAKILAAEQEGAVAVIICNNVPDPAVITMGAGAVGNQVTIPAVMMSLQDCNELKLGLPELSAELSAPQFQVPQPGPTGRSSDFDNGVIVHEYTHGISIRLTGGAGNSGCLSNDEQAGEGWSDWFALVMTTTPEMTPGQPRGIGTYAAGQSPNGDGIRTYPYSRSMSVNPHTYANINEESIPHGVGSVWCVTIWDLFWNLVDEYGYDPDLYFGAGGNNIAMQLVMDGLKLQACSPTFIDSRDAILEADMLNYGGANQCLIWETFARRGLGVDAAPGGNEDFTIPDACNFTFRVNKTAVAEADAGSVITYNLEITNGREETVENAVITDKLPEGTTLVPGSSDCNITEEDGILTISLGTIESGFTGNCSYQLQLPETPFTYATFEDDAENGDQAWNFENTLGGPTWSLSSADANDGVFSYYAANVNSASNQIMVTSEPVVLDGENPALSFWHRYDTEANFDGGVVEISPGNTNLWFDLGPIIIQNGYDRALSENSDSPLAGRRAFHGDSEGWQQTIVDLSNYAGATVRVRFRFATDSQVAADGWYVDDIRFLGNLHFVSNTACTINDGEELCSSAITLVNGDLLNDTEELSSELGLTIFPNPTDDRFVLRLNRVLDGAVEMRILGTDGRLLERRRYDAFQSEEVDMTPYGAGVYFVQLRTDTGTITHKLIVQ